MVQAELTAERGMVSRAVPPAVAFVGKIVLEVLPAALASLIGGILFAHYQFGQPATPQPAALAAGPASAAMVQLIGEEHAMIRNLLIAQQAAENRALVAGNADSAPAEMAARMAEAANRRADSKSAAAKPRALPRAKPVVVAAAIVAPPPVVAQVDQYRLDAHQVLPPLQVSAAPAAPAHPSIVATTLAIPRRVVSGTLHAVGAIGGIPSWIGHRFDNGSAAAAPSSAAS